MSAVYFNDPKPGSISDAYKIKILICYVFYKVKAPMTKEELIAVFQNSQTINYFNVCQAFAELLKSGHIIIESLIGEEPLYSLTNLGVETAENLQETLPLSAKEKNVKIAKQILKEEHENKNRQINITKSEDGYFVHLILKDIGSDLFELKLFVPDENEAKQIKRQMKSKTSLLYQGILAILLNQTKDLAQVLQEIEHFKV